MTKIAEAAASILVPLVVRAVDVALDERGVRQTVVKNGIHHRKHHRRHPGVVTNGHITPSQQRTLAEMGAFNKGNGGSIFLLPSSSKKPPHSVARVANNLERAGMIKLLDDEQFVLTAKGKLQADHK
jgi:hypothetical protein